MNLKVEHQLMDFRPFKERSSPVKIRYSRYPFFDVLHFEVDREVEKEKRHLQDVLGVFF